mgnify:CR=1 FL=1
MNTIEIKKNFDEIRSRIAKVAEKFSKSADNIKLIAVSKTHSADILANAFEAGVCTFGENYVQELIEKHSKLIAMAIKPEWHFIGHLQSNKVKYIAEFIHTIHSVDSVKLAVEISKQAKKFDRTINVLLQINTSGEDSKSGCEPSMAVSLAKEIIQLPNI